MTVWKGLPDSHQKRPLKVTTQSPVEQSLASLRQFIVTSFVKRGSLRRCSEAGGRESATSALRFSFSDVFFRP